jgi:hypothetical protein
LASVSIPTTASAGSSRARERVVASVRAWHGTASREARVLRRVRWVWWLLFMNVLGTPTGGLLHLPRVVAELISQGALAAAFLVALTVNPRLKLRPSLYLGIFSLLGTTSLMMSIRLVSLGTAYRGFRLVTFIAVLWLLTPWWGRREGFLLRAQLRFLTAVLVSVVVGFLIAPGHARAGGRLGGVIWPIASTQVAHYSAEFAGLMMVLWVSRVLKGRVAIPAGVISFIVLILTHTRTALVAAVVGFAVAALSLVVVRRRVRRMFASLAVMGVVIILPLSPVIITWLARGESPAQIADLSGRTNFWSDVFAEPRPLVNEILGNGISNGSIFDPSDRTTNGTGLPIDSSWVEDYQDQGIAGDILTGCMFLALLICAAYSPRGPARAVALFLIVYCVLASITEDGAGIASQYALDLTVAASLLGPGLARSARRRRAVREIGLKEVESY